jgi:hypothetical protein
VISLPRDVGADPAALISKYASPARWGDVFFGDMTAVAPTLSRVFLMEEGPLTVKTWLSTSESWLDECLGLREELGAEPATSLSDVSKDARKISKISWVTGPLGGGNKAICAL